MSHIQSEEVPLPHRLTASAALCGVVTAPYLLVGRWVPPAGAPHEHLLDALVPFLPWTVWVYLPGYWCCFLVTLWVVRNPRELRAAFVGLASLTMLALPFFLHWPIPAPRPPAPLDATWTAELVRWLYTTDPAGNTFPSLHVANATYCAVVTTASSRRWGAVAWLLAGAVAVSVLTLKQHWVADIPAGWALAVAGAGVWRAQLAAPGVLEWAPERRRRSDDPLPKQARAGRRSGG